MSAAYEILKGLYLRNKINSEKLQIAVFKGWITEDEKNMIISGV